MAPNLKRIILVAPSGIGGVQALSGNLAREFSRRGAEVDILFEDICSDSSPAREDRLPESRSAPKNAPAAFIQCGDKVKCETFQYDLNDNHAVVCQRLQRIIGAGYGVAYPNTSGMAYRAIASLGARRPVAIAGCLSDFEHDYETVSRFAPFWDGVFVNSSIIAERLRARLSAGAPPIDVIAPGIAAPEAIAPRENAGPLRIVFCGRLSAVKRIPDILAVAQALREKRVDFSLTFIGDGEDRQDVEAQIRRANLENIVYITGAVPPGEVLERMDKAHIILLLSEREGFGLCILEGMSRGVVPIVSRTCGVRDAIRDGKNGFLVGMGDIAKVADIIAGMSGNREQLSELSKVAHETCRREYSPKKEIERHLSMIAAAAGRHAVNAPLAPPAGALFSRLDHPWIPNPVVRFIRRARRLK